MAAASSPRAGWNKRVFAKKADTTAAAVGDLVGSSKVVVLANEIKCTDAPEELGGDPNPIEYGLQGQGQRQSVPGQTSAPQYDFGVERDFSAPAAAFQLAQDTETWTIAYLWSDSERGDAIPAADFTVEGIVGQVAANKRVSASEDVAKRMITLTHQRDLGPFAAA